MDAKSGLVGLPSVLIVDDLPEIREMLCQFLADEGHVVAAAADGREALMQLRGGLRPGVIVSDLHMPEMDGERLCRMLSQDPSLARVPVVLVSAEPWLPEVAAAVGAWYLRKPLDLRRLLRFVRQPIK